MIEGGSRAPRHSAPTRRHVLRWGATLALAAPTIARAQWSPQRPITLVVPFSAGGGTDIIARELGRYLSDRLGQPVVVDNKGGGGGTIAAQSVARAKPDGHTLLLITSTFITSASSERQLPYDVLRDFTPVAFMGRGPLLVVVNKETGITSIQGLIERARTKPDSLNFVSSGPGSITQLAAELFKQRTATQMTHVPYKGSGPATLDLVGGQGQVFFSTVPTILSFVRSDKVRLLAVTSRERSPLFPDTPTVIEAGVGDYDVSTWWGIVGPPGTPEPVTRTLNEAVNAIVGGEAMRKRFADEGAETVQALPAALTAQLVEELALWRRVVREGGLRFD